MKGKSKKAKGESERKAHGTRHATQGSLAACREPETDRRLRD